MSARTTRWIVVAAIVVLILGTILSRAVEPGVRVPWKRNGAQSYPDGAIGAPGKNVWRDVNPGLRMLK
jgi:hypothetical protein